MKSKIILVQFLIITLYWGCKDERTPEMRNISQELKDWMFFDTGTWWLYQNVQTEDLDSQFVTKSDIFYIESEKTKNAPYTKKQFIQIFLNNQHYFSISSTENCKLQRITNGEGSYTYLIFKPNNNPLTVGERRSSCSSLGYTEITAIEENFTLDNVYYNTKITVFDNKDCTENGDSVQYQLFKGVGIINKKNLTKNEEWKLIKYYIKLNKN